MYFCEADIKQLGVRNSAHRARIVSSLVAFRDKFENGKNRTASTPLSHLHIYYVFEILQLFAIAIRIFVCVLVRFNDARCGCDNKPIQFSNKYIQKVVTCETIYLEHVC